MKFLLDQDVYAVTARFLAGLGHDVATASSIGLSAADDSILLTRAHHEGRVFVTRDRDFGELVYAEQRPAKGVVLIRLKAKDQWERLAMLRPWWPEIQACMPGSFVVVTNDRLRIRPLQKP